MTFIQFLNYGNLASYNILFSSKENENNSKTFILCLFINRLVQEITLE